MLSYMQISGRAQGRCKFVGEVQRRARRLARSLRGVGVERRGVVAHRDRQGRRASNAAVDVGAAAGVALVNPKLPGAVRSHKRGARET